MLAFMTMLLAMVAATVEASVMLMTIGGSRDPDEELRRSCRRCEQ